MIVGIDIGTQSLKAVVVDPALQTLGRGRAGYVVTHPRPDRAEQDPRSWEQALAPAVAAALTEAQVDARQVQAIGIAGQLDGCVPVASDGRALGPCLIWMDRRADGVLDAVRRAVPAEVFRRRTGTNLDGGHMGPKIRWLVENDYPAGTARFLQPVSYLVERLTGAAVMDAALASTTLLYDLAAGDFAEDLLQTFRVERAQLPALARADAPAGHLNREGARLTGLREGVAVAVGTGDDFSTPIGAGIMQPGTIVDVLGTAEVVGALHAEPLIDPTALLETHRYPVGGLYYLENPGWASGGALEWLRGLLGFSDFAALDAAAAAVPPGSDGLLFLPALTGAMTPEWIAGARGCFYGLTTAHGPGHLARAVLEGTAFGLRDVAETLRALGVGASRVRVLGGGARSRLWCRIRADLCGLPVERPAEVDTSPVGAALLAAAAAGLVPSVEVAAMQLGGVAETVEPDRRARSIYDEAHARYRRLFESLKPMFAAG